MGGKVIDIFHNQAFEKIGKDMFHGLHMCVATEFKGGRVVTFARAKLKDAQTFEIAVFQKPIYSAIAPKIYSPANCLITGQGAPPVVAKMEIALASFPANSQIAGLSPNFSRRHRISPPLVILYIRLNALIFSSDVIGFSHFKKSQRAYHLKGQACQRQGDSSCQHHYETKLGMDKSDPHPSY